MLKKTMSSLALSALLLTACGGGDDGGTPSPKPNNPQQQNKPTSNANNELEGEVMVISNGREIRDSDTPDYGDLNTLNVDGKKLTIVPNGMSGRIVSISDSQSSIKVGGNMQYSRFGIITPKADNVNYVFYQGKNETAKNDMPTADGVKYQGGATVIVNNQQFTGDSAFTVNFASKTIDGEISNFNGNSKIPLQARIDGNDFEGTHNGTEVDGDFFGPQAAEMAGVFKNQSAGTFGAFGAKKQK